MNQRAGKLSFFRSAFAVAVAVTVLFVTTPPYRAVVTLPDQISDKDFWAMIVDLSEDGGFFRFENFISNEEAFQFVIPQLKNTVKPGGVYIGVGPEQNFTYVAAMEPRLSFIIDIRRQNMLEHLLYKALFEVSTNRPDFISRLFSRRRPLGLTDAATARELFEAYGNVKGDPLLFGENMRTVTDQLTRKHQFPLTTEDLETIEYVYTVFFEAGPALDYSTGGTFGGFGGRRMPNYADLMTATDREGESRSFLATERNFQIVRQRQERNLIVPLVGDFAGDKTIRQVGAYLRQHDAAVSVFYLSNVEQYLFQQRDGWRLFYSNVESLPLDASSTFIRSASRGNFGQATYGMRFMSLLSPMNDVVDEFRQGRIRIYYDVLDLSTSP
jgi:hypothetical protein